MEANSSLGWRLATIFGLLFASAMLYLATGGVRPAAPALITVDTAHLEHAVSHGAQPLAGKAVASPALPTGVVSVRYEPSADEALWRSNIGTWMDRICVLLANEHRQSTQRIMDVLVVQGHADFSSEGYVPATLAEVAGLVDELDAEGLLSKMIYTYADGRVETIRLEPLIGGLRDPRTLCGGTDIGPSFLPPLNGPTWQVAQNVMWVLMDPRIPRAAGLGVPKPLPAAMRGGVQPSYRRALLFDLGGSKWMHASGARWITWQFERMGVHFDHIYIWEAVEVPSVAYYEGATVDARSRLHFYNFPVVADPGHTDNPLTMLKQVATPEDLVVFKLDIDTPEVEHAMLRQMLADPEVTALVDEVMYEDHVEIPDFHWLWREGAYAPLTIADSYELFSKLREAGIRAHSWP